MQVREQLLGTGVVHRVELEPRTGSMLVCYDERKVEAAVIEGAVIKLLGLDAAINGKQKSRMENGLHTILDAVDRGVMGATNGLMDGQNARRNGAVRAGDQRMAARGSGCAGRSDALVVGGPPVRGDRCGISWEKRFCATASSRVWNAICRSAAHALSPQRAAAQRGAAPICIMFRTF